MRRRLTAPATALVAAVGVLGFLLTPTAAAVGAPTSTPASTQPLGGDDPSFDLTSTAVSRLRVSVPPGVLPQAVTGSLEVGEVDPGTTITFTVGGRVALIAPASDSDSISIPVSSSDVDDGALAIAMRYGVSSACPNGLGAADVRLSDAQLVYAGSETPPADPSVYFAAKPSRVDVTVPARASDDLLEAGLLAVAALARRFPDVSVAMSSIGAKLPRTGPGQRVLVLKSGPASPRTALQSTFGLTRLLVRGRGESLLATVREVVGAPTGDAPAATDEPSVTRVLDQLVARDVEVVGPTPAHVDLPIPHDAFGRPVSSLRLDLRATHSELPADAQVTVEASLDGVVLDRQVLSDAPAFALSLAADVGAGGPQSTLRVAISAVSRGSASTSCGDGAVVSVDVGLDTRSSSVTGVAASEDPVTFGGYPPVLRGDLPVAIRATGRARLDAAIDASYLVAALQRVSAASLSVSLIDPDDLVAGESSGLLVGADADDSEALGAPLALDSFDAAGQRAEYPLTSDEPFAALESVAFPAHRVLLLGSWRPSGDGEDPEALRSLAQSVADDGWGTLDGDVRISVDGADPVDVDSGQAVPDPIVDTTNDGGLSPGGYVAAALLLTALLLAQAWRALRGETTPTREGT